ncbi:enolase C-terminal domain-like protein [Rhodococcus sp. NPDC003322]
MSRPAADTTTGDVVRSVRARAYTVPTETPEADGTLEWDSTTIVLVEARAADAIGIGWTYGPAACAMYVESKLAALVRGADPMDVGGVFDRMIRAVRNDGRPGAVGFAISAVDTALWDLKARILGVPLCALLGRIHDSVPVYGSGGLVNYDETRLRDQLAGWVDGQAIPRVKIKIGQDRGTRTGRDLARIARARKVVGDRAELYVDANGGYSRKQAIRVAHSAGEHRISWFEEPVSSDDLAGLREVRNAVQPDVTAGEYGCEPFYFQRMCDAEAVDCLQVDASRCGGITEWTRVAAIAAAHGLEVSAHCAPHLHAHVAAATPNIRHLEWFHDHVRIESMFFDGVLDPTGGSVTPDPSAPGTGLTLRTNDIEGFRAL